MEGRKINSKYENPIDNILLYIVVSYNNETINILDKIIKKYNKYSLLFNFNPINNTLLDNIHKRCNCYIDINNTLHKYNAILNNSFVILLENDLPQIKQCLFVIKGVVFSILLFSNFIIDNIQPIL